MREKYESLSLAALRDLAKSRGMKKISALRKAELIDAILAEEGDTGANSDRPLQQEKKQAAKEPEQGKDPAVPDSDGPDTSKAADRGTPLRQGQETAQEPPRTQGRPADEESEGTHTRRKRGESRTRGKRTEPAEENKSRRKRVETAEENKSRGRRMETTEENKSRGKRTEVAEEHKNHRKRTEAAEENKSRGRRTETTEENKNRGRRTETAEENRSRGKRTEAAEENRSRGKRTEAAEENKGRRKRAEAAEESKSRGRHTEAAEDPDEGKNRAGQTEVSEEGRTHVRHTESAHTRDHRENQGESSGSGQPRTEYARTEAEFDTGVKAHGILEVMADGYGFIRCENYLPGDNDVYVSPSLIRRFNLKTGDFITGNMRLRSQGEKFGALLFVSDVNGYTPFEAAKRTAFEDLTPIFPNERIRLETDASGISMRIMDLIAPVGKGQRGMIVSPPKAGKTTLLKEVARSVRINNPEMHLIILLIDERPEEVTDIKEAIESENAEVIYSTFDELPEHHKRVSEMVIERAKRLVEHGQDVIILLDSITRLARAYNLVVPPSGRTLSGGLDPAALHMPKRFFGAARNMREGGSLTILATALVDTGSKMDDVVYEEFKGTGNMELILDRHLSEKRIFPAIDIVKSGTRREDLLLNPEEQEAVNLIRKGINGMKTEESVESILRLFIHTRNNHDFVNYLRKKRIFP